MVVYNQRSFKKPKIGLITAYSTFKIIPSFTPAKTWPSWQPSQPSDRSQRSSYILTPSKSFGAPGHHRTPHHNVQSLSLGLAVVSVADRVGSTCVAALAKQPFKQRIKFGDRSASPPDSTLIRGSSGHSGWIEARTHLTVRGTCGNGTHVDQVQVKRVNR